MYLKTVTMIGTELEKAGIPYQFKGQASLRVQGASISEEPIIEASVQWDVLEEAKGIFTKYSPTDISSSPESAVFSFTIDTITIYISCEFNTTIKTDPYRISVELNQTNIWCRSLYSYFYNEEMARYSDQIHAFLAKEQQGFTAENEQAWNQNNYSALLNRYGKPEALVEKIKQNPKWRLKPFYQYMGNLQGKSVMHLMGSNGVKAVAMAILGARVTVVDFSKENAAFAKELADTADVPVEYIVSDVLSLPDSEGSDLVLMELGVLHYMIDLQPLMEKIKSLLKPGGLFILHEFHPISTKLITSSGKKHKVSGNYFEPSIEKNKVAFTKHMPDEEQKSLSQVVQRKWTLGELITAIGQSGLMIKVLEEEPNHKVHDIGIPKTYTIVAEKLNLE